jgi:hypothetical protein
MDKMIFFTFIFINLFCSDILGQDKLSNNDSIKSRYDFVLIKYVSFTILTPIKVNCRELDIAFGDKVKSKFLTDSTQIDSLELLINRLEFNENKKLPDVRLEIYLTKKDKPDDILCLGENRLMYNGIPMKRNDELIKFIKKLIQ